MTRHTLWFCLLGILLGGCAEHDETERPNVVLITIDTLRADRLGCYGHPASLTPHLDEFAKSATVFELATSVTNNTLPSHAAMLTGKHPQNFGIPRNSIPLGEQHETLATILQERGYDTAAFISAAALHSKLGLARGFDVYDEAFDVQELDQLQRRGNATTSKALAWLRGVPHDDPFFLWLHYFDPHSPYTPPGPFASRYTKEYTGRANGSIEFLCAVDGIMGFEKVETDAADLDYLVSLYDAETAFLDWSLGPILDFLEQTPYREETLVIFTADHGENLTEHEFRFSHAQNIYQTSMHVPLIIRWPEAWDPVASPTDASVQAETRDIFATTLEVLELPFETTASISLLPVGLDPKDSVRRISFGESSRPWNLPQQSPEEWPNLFKGQFALEYPWKLILTPYRGMVELFHLENDPGEMRDVAREHPEVVERLTEELRAWRSTAGRQGAEADAENLEQMKSLGYVE